MLKGLLTRLSLVDTTLPAPLARGFQYLYLEIAFASVLGAIVTFHGPFAIRLGATTEQVALLNAVPALVAALVSIPSARFLEHRRQARRYIFGSLLLMRIGIGLIALIPLLFPKNSDAALALIVWVIILNVPLIVFTNGFQALLAQVVPEQHRARVIARRQAFWSAGMVVTSAVAGLWLDQVAFPLNYQLMYAFGFAVVLGSQYYLGRLDALTMDMTHSAALPTVPRLATAPNLPAPSEKVRLSGPMARLLVNTAVYNVGLTLGASLFPVFFINTLGASDAWIGVNGAANFAGVIVGNFLWARLLRRHNFSWALRRATLLTWLFPVGVALFPDLTFVLLIGIFINLIHPGVDLASLNLMLKLSEASHRTVYLSWYNAVLNGALFAGPLIGVWLANSLGVPTVFILSGVVRLVGGLLNTFNLAAEPDGENGRHR